MKKFLIVGAGALLVLATTAAIGHAQSIDVVTADIPFPFIANNEAPMPAGTYEFSVANANNPDVWVIHAIKGTKEAMVETDIMQQEDPAPQTELVFDDLGNDHFLRQIWIEGRLDGREVLPTKQEQALEKQGVSKSKHHVPATHGEHSSRSMKH